MATDGSGVQMFDGENFTHHSVSDGVTAGETFAIYADDFDNIWVELSEVVFVIMMERFGIVLILEMVYYKI